MGKVGPTFYICLHKGWGGWPHPPYGQPDRKKTVFFTTSLRWTSLGQAYISLCPNIDWDENPFLTNLWWLWTFGQGNDIQCTITFSLGYLVCFGLDHAPWLDSVGIAGTLNLDWLDCWLARNDDKLKIDLMSTATITRYSLQINSSHLLV